MLDHVCNPRVGHGVDLAMRWEGDHDGLTILHCARIHEIVGMCYETTRVTQRPSP